jgi:hypothetical protein
MKCNDPRWRWLLLALTALGVFVAALFLYIFGRLFGAGIVYSSAVTLLFCFASAGGIALALLI